MSNVRPDYDALVIGGGLAGAAAACHLALARKSVILFEKAATARHTVCGEFLSAEAQSALRHLGVDIAELGAVPIRIVRLIHGNRSAKASLPFQAAGLSRHILDEHLLQRAQALGVQVVRGTFVRDVTQGAASHWVVATPTHAQVAARAVFLASGKHDLRQFKRASVEPDHDIGFKIHLRLAPAQTHALRHAVEVILYDGGYAGLQLIDEKTANLCLLVRKSVFLGLNKSWQNLLDHLTETSPHLRRRLAGALPCWDEPLAIFSLPFGYLCDDPETASGLYRIGDQFSVIPAFAGNGMSIALHTARLAAACFVQGHSGTVYQARARQQVGASLRLASRLSRLSAMPWTQGLAVQICRAFPFVATVAAAKTRISAVS
jgi:flavin-dependent dehydrogenase